MKKIALVLLAMVMLNGCFATVPSHRPYAQIPIEWNSHEMCIVYAKGGWQDSTVELQNGDKFFLDAKGRWSAGLGWESGPSGVIGPDLGRVFPEEKAASALIGRVGFGSPFTIGDQYLGSATYSGNLFMRMNDTLFGDNYGFLHVDIYVQRKAKSSNKQSAALGTGWPITLGYVVTNHHVIEGYEKITLILSNGKKIPASVLVGDKTNDIVLLKVANPKELPPALPIAIAKPGIGAKVFTIGYPHPDILGGNPKLTDGLISSVSGFRDDPRTYQITVPLQAGNSGGPLLNFSGEVVGIVTSKLNAVRVFKWTGDLPQNVNYAVKISYLKALLDSVIVQSYPINELTKEPDDLEKLAKRIQDSVMIVLVE